jgi:hypothetical protein
MGVAPVPAAVEDPMTTIIFFWAKVKDDSIRQNARNVGLSIKTSKGVMVYRAGSTKGKQINKDRRWIPDGLQKWGTGSKNKGNLVKSLKKTLPDKLLICNFI